MPGTVSGFATLRTTFTKLGILALNVGIIDPFFKGPISTALINFSDRPREIRVGDKFFRVQLGPFADIKEAEAMRSRLVNDGYNPILKK